MPGWIQTAANFNPVGWSVDAAREALQAQPNWSIVITRFLYLGASRWSPRGSPPGPFVHTNGRYEIGMRSAECGVLSHPACHSGAVRSRIAGLAGACNRDRAEPRLQAESRRRGLELSEGPIQADRLVGSR